MVITKGLSVACSITIGKSYSVPSYWMKLNESRLGRGGGVGARPQPVAWAAGANAPFQFPRIGCGVSAQIHDNRLE